MAKPIDKKKCIVCGGEKLIQKDFYQSHSRVWGKIDGKFPICKDCIIELHNYYLTEKKLEERAAIIACCRKLDIFFSNDLYAGALEDAKRRTGVPLISIYISKANLVLSNKKWDYTFEDSELGELIEQNFKVGHTGYEITREQRDKLSDFWGAQYTTEVELVKLHRMYEKYLKNYSNDFVKREYFKMLCKAFIQLENTTDLKEKEAITKQIASLTKEANISPQQTEKSKTEDDIRVLGVRFRDIETVEPLDYMINDKPAYKDARGYKKYIEDYFVKAVKKAFNVNNG